MCVTLLVSHILYQPYAKHLQILKSNGALRARQLLVMYRRESNNFVPNAEPNAHCNNQHGGPGSDSALPKAGKRKGKRGGNKCKESIAESHSNPVANVGCFDRMLLNPFAHCNNGFYPNAIPLLNPTQQFQTPSSFNYQQLQQQFNYSVSFRREDRNVPGTSSTSDNGALRNWKDTKLGSIIKSNDNSNRSGVFFSIMNYNVLAQDLLVQHPEIYRRHNKNALDWEVRWRNLVNEIVEHDCDILCLQEVQQSHLDDYYKDIKNLGYEGVYKQATGIKTDGCAIYYKTNKFKLIEHITVEYKQPNIDLLNRDNIAIVAKFAPVDNLKFEFVVATTHLLYNPRREDVRLAQSQVLLTEVERIAFNGSNSEYLPIIISGDFNSTPNTTIYELFASGSTNYMNVLKYRYSMTPWISPQLNITENCQHANLLNYRKRNMKLSRKEEFDVINLQHSENGIVKKLSKNDNGNKDNTICHSFNLKSVYENRVNVEGTTYQDEWVIVDYIFYSAKRSENKLMDKNLVLLSYYTLPRGNKLKSLVIPNNQLGSDHLSLVAKFKLEY